MSFGFKIAKSFLKSKQAFSLAEVLITLGIVGVIASMTLPAIIKDIKKKDLISANQKTRAVLTTVLSQAALENAGSLSGLNLGAELSNYMKLSKNCITSSSNKSSCWHGNNVVKLKQRDGSYSYMLGTTTNAVQAMDGTLIRVDSGNLDCDKTSASTTCWNIDYTTGWCGTIYADVNGFRGPNVYGQDVREIWFWSDGYIIFPGDSSSGRSRWSGTKTKPNEEYQSGGSCYDPNDYSTNSLNG